MAFSLKTEQEDLFGMLDGKISVKPTRALVVSNRDPLFCGRVKVWIPSIHGISPQSNKKDGDIDKEPPMPQGGFDPSKIQLDTENLLDTSNIVQQQIISGLPWAKCLGSNWGPRLESTKGGLISGLFSIPKVGTEVYVTFEDDNPDLPIIMGSIIHANEFTYKPNVRVELFPGIPIDPNRIPTAKLTDELIENEYITDSSSCYSIRAENGSTLLISDQLKSSCILLNSAMRYSDVNQMTDDLYSDYKQQYPCFPTTQSAPFAARNPIIPSIINRANVNTQLTATPDGGATISQIPVDISTGSGGANNLSTDKMWPVAPDKGSAVPPYSTNTGMNGGAFGAGRIYNGNPGKHIGLDLQVVKATLRAPISLRPIKYWRSDTAGLTLVCYSPVDGTGHMFCHLENINAGIRAMMDEHKASIIPVGTQLGTTGNSGRAGGVYGHLHWEIYKRPSSKINTVEDFMSKMYNNAHGGLGINACIDPVEWIRSGDSKIILDSTEQARHMVDHTAYVYTSNDAPDKRKPIGLEICTIPGKESVMIRHSSGSYMGFDPDGNFILYTCGDSNIKVNRSWNLDVLGGILEVCHAKFTRVRTVLKEWSNVVSRVRDIATADKTFPSFFRRAEKQREIDINDAIRSNIKNAYFVHANKETDETVKTPIFLAIKPGAGYSTPATTTPKDFDNTYYDTLIQKQYSRYINNSELKQIFPDWKLFKAQMLKESNADAKAYATTTMATGLFQVTPIAVQDVTGSKPSDMSIYFDAETNIDMAFRVTLRNCNYIKSYTKQRDSEFNIITNIDPLEFRNMCFLSYIVGGPTVGKVLKSDINKDSLGINYADIEALYKSKFDKSYASLSYVPTIDYIYDELKSREKK